jgi:hypothetical protein
MYPKGAFYMAPTRAWEFGLGAMLVFLPALSGAAAMLAPAAGLFAIAGGLLVADTNFLPAPSALLSCLGAALVIWPRSCASPLSNALAVLRPIGLASYSLYLWHWPIWVLFRTFANADQPSITEAIALATFSLFVAALSYRFIEQPCRRIALPPHRTIAVGIASCLFLVSAAAYIHSSDGLPDRMPREYFATRSLDAMWEWHCRYEAIGLDGPSRCTFGTQWSSATHRAVLWGDSNAEHLMPLLEAGAIATRTAVALLRTCPATTDGEILRLQEKYLEYPNDNIDCPIIRKKIFDFLLRDESIDTVIISASWTYYLEHIESNDQSKTFELALGDLFSMLLKMHKQVVMVATIPQWPHAPPLCLYGKGLIRRPCADSIIIRSINEEKQLPSLTVLQRVADRYPSVKFVRPSQGMCHDDTCDVVVNGNLIYRDAVHLRRNLDQETNLEVARMAGLSDVFIKPIANVP